MVSGFNHIDLGDITYRNAPVKLPNLDLFAANKKPLIATLNLNINDTDNINGTLMFTPLVNDGQPGYVSVGTNAILIIKSGSEWVILSVE